MGGMPEHVVLVVRDMALARCWCVEGCRCCVFIRRWWEGEDAGNEPPTVRLLTHLAVSHNTGLPFVP